MFRALLAFVMVGCGVLCVAARDSKALAAPATQPAKEIELDCGKGVKMKLVYIPPGKFMLGSPEDELPRGIEEIQHQVTLTRPFYMGATEATQAQWQVVMGTSIAEQAHKCHPSSSPHGEGPDHPMYYVSWHEATDFCRKLSEKTGRKLRLPTEAEWEYACRAGTTTAFHTGATISTDQANYDGSYIYGRGVKGISRRTTVAVGSFAPNAWGLYDMHGNVEEWCADWYRPYPKGDATDPTGPTNGAQRVVRGGSWGCSPQNVRSAARAGWAPDLRFNQYFGFRVIMDSPKVALRQDLRAKQAWDMSMSWEMKGEMAGEVHGVALGNQQVNVTVNGTVTCEEVKDGLPVKVKMEFGKDCRTDMVMMGQKTSPPFRQTGMTVTATRAADGTLDIAPEEALNPDVDLVMRQIMDAGAEFCSPGPVGAGDKWEVKRETLEKMMEQMKGIEGKMEFTLVKFGEVQGRKCAEITEKGQIKGTRHQRPVTVEITATVMMDLATGVVLSGEYHSVVTELPTGQQGVPTTKTVWTMKQTMTPRRTPPDR